MGPCDAQKGNCPVQKESTHYATNEQARKESERILQEHHGFFGKGSTPQEAQDQDWFKVEDLAPDDRYAVYSNPDYFDKTYSRAREWVKR